MKYAYRLLAALLTCVTSLTSLASVTASLGRDHIALGETVQLLLQNDHSPDEQPDLAPLKNDFTVLGTSSGSTIQIVNGHLSSLTQLSLALSPKHEGKILIPSLQWGGEQSPALELIVSGSSAEGQAGTATDTAHVFLTATVDHSQPYVQSAVVLTVRLYADQTLYQASLSPPVGGDVLIKQLGKDKQGIESRNGRSYQVIERKYLLSPLRSGPITLQGPTLDAMVPNAQNDNFFGSVFGRMQMPSIVDAAHPLHLQAKPITLKVLSRPAGAASTNWLPAQKVMLKESWIPGNTSVHAGEPLTRHISLSALGLADAQLPDPNTLMPVPNSIKLYPDKSRVDNKLQGTTILGTREQNIALIIAQPGRYKLPTIRLAWWDTTANVQREATLPARVLDVLPAAGNISGDMVTSAPSSSASTMTPNRLPTDTIRKSIAFTAPMVHVSLWLWASLGLGILFFGTLLAWWKSRHRIPKVMANNFLKKSEQRVVSGRTSFKAFQQACHNNDPHMARKHLLAWAATAWPEHPPAGLNALSGLISDEISTKLLRHLDRACYTDSAWQGESLVQALPKPPASTTPAKRKRDLPNLYQ